MYKEVKLLHRDISMGNLAFYMKGDQYIIVLLDFDLATTTDSAENSSQRRTGTAPFMSRDVLSAIGPEGKYIHHVRHDLESIFFVIIWYGFGYDARGPRPGKPDLLRAWRVGDYIKIYEAKKAFISDTPPTLLNAIESNFYRGFCTHMHVKYHKRQRRLAEEWMIETEKAAKIAKAEALQQGRTKDEAGVVYHTKMGESREPQNGGEITSSSAISFKQWMEASGDDISEKHSGCSCCKEDLVAH